MLSFIIMLQKESNLFKIESDLNGMHWLLYRIEMSISANERNYSGVNRSLIHDTACNILTFQMTHIRLYSKHEANECDTQGMYV